MANNWWILGNNSITTVFVLTAKIVLKPLRFESFSRKLCNSLIEETTKFWANSTFGFWFNLRIGQSERFLLRFSTTTWPGNWISPLSEPLSTPDHIHYCSYYFQWSNFWNCFLFCGSNNINEPIASPRLKHFPPSRTWSDYFTPLSAIKSRWNNEIRL